MKTVAFDLEVAKLIITKKDTPDQLAIDEGRAVHGWGEAHKAGISSAVAYVFEQDRYYIFGDRAQEHRALADLLTGAEQVVGFNHIIFDYQLLATTLQTPLAELTDVEAAPGERDIDLLQMIWGGIGRQDFASVYGLNKVSAATLGALGGKNGDGANAPELYQQGRWGELLDYNLRDVDLTQRLARFVWQYGFIVSGVNNVVRVKHPDAWFRQP